MGWERLLKAIRPAVKETPALRGAPKLADSFSMFTAENPRALTLTSEENALRRAALQEELQSRGIDFKPATGAYGPTPESPFYIPHTEEVTPQLINELGRKYGQESVIHKMGDLNRLQYVSGPNAGKAQVGKGVVIDPSLTENFSEVDGIKFRLNLNDEFEPHLVHYSRADKPLTEIDPAFMGTGAAGKEQQRGNIVPRSFYYEQGTHPEDIVTQQAKNVHRIVRPENVLDWQSDEALELRRAAKDLNDLERRAKEAGYAGFKNTDGPLPNGVALFEKQPVIYSEPTNSNVVDLSEAAKELVRAKFRK